MDNRFVDMICEMENIESPNTIRMRCLTELVQEQLYEERLNQRYSQEDIKEMFQDIFPLSPNEE